MKNYVLGVDGGGSKTDCIIMDETTRIIAQSRAGGANHNLVGSQAAFLAIEEAIKRATEEVKGVEINALALGLAGVSQPKDIQKVQKWIQQLQNSTVIKVNWCLSPENIVITHDADIALVGGTSQGTGIIVNAGTGSIIFGRNAQGKTKRVGGCGYLLGDDGSAYNIVIKGIKAALKSEDGTGEKTTLSSVIQEYLELENLEQITDIIYQWGVKEIAKLAPLVFQTALDGDKIATDIIEQGVMELVQGTKVIRESLFSSTETVEIVTVGSVWQSAYPLRSNFERLLVQQFPETKIILPYHQPVYGAALLALKTINNICQ